MPGGPWNSAGSIAAVFDLVFEKGLGVSAAHQRRVAHRAKHSPWRTGVGEGPQFHWRRRGASARLFGSQVNEGPSRQTAISSAAPCCSPPASHPHRYRKHPGQEVTPLRQRSQTGAVSV
ncbi:hypothetical protein AAFF_G00105330 [Aldrovandia affinis]|uniref:Uncharacterized protein n=1 Tax=Aldrovandia affinis TaxID=143900 RepID=A0AAD7T235_9TELE|nr:hypothetical protein AAFF_G00105330 [Aldrovandia affinis]